MVNRIKTGDSDADLILDMTTLVIAGTKHAALLEKTNFNFELLKDAEILGGSMGSLFAKSKADKYKKIDARLIFTKLYFGSKKSGQVYL